MLKRIVRAATLALALFWGIDIANLAASAQTRHVAGAAQGAKAQALHSDRTGFFVARRHHASHHARGFAQNGWRQHLMHRRFRAHFGASSPPGQPPKLHPLLAVASHYVGHGRVSRQRGPWCRDFINAVARRAGFRLANTSRRAIDALRLGRRVASPRPGDLVVMRHHVTIFAGYGGRGLIGLGGNQGGGGVTYSSFSRRRVIGYIRM